MIVRFDDVCINSNMDLHNKMTDWLFEKFPDCEVIWAISPIVFNMDNYSDDNKQRVFPSEIKPISDYKIFFGGEKIGLPEVKHDGVQVASHGLCHVDHRLLSRGAQEMSILVSCAILGPIFIPPFNKWNQDTKDICDEARIELIRFEDGWLSMEHNRYDKNHELWYLHARCWTFESFKAWFEK